MTTETLTLSQFLLERIAEDETVAEAEWRRVAGAARRNGKTRVRRRLATLAAHRWLVEQSTGPVAHAGQDIERDNTLRALASIYADHPAFDLDWRANA